MSTHINEISTNILTGVFGKVGGNVKNYNAVVESGIETFDKPSFDYLWSQQQKHFQKTNEVISWPVFKVLIAKNKKLTPDIKMLYLSEVKPLFDKNEYRRIINNRLIKFSISELKTIKRHTEFTAIVHNHFANANSGNVEDIDEALQQTLAALNQRLIVDSGGSDFEITNYGDSFDSRQEARRKEKEQPNDYKRYMFPYKDLCRVFPRGVRPGDLLLLSGVSGVGKSITAIDVARSAAAQGLEVVVVISENSLSQTMGRLDANLTGEKYDLIQSYGFNDQEIKNFHSVFNKAIDAAKRINIVKVSPNNFTVMMINRAINKLKKETGIKPDVIVIDSPDLMRPSFDMKITGEHATRVSSTAVYWEVKTFGVDHQYIMVATTQMNRAAAKKGSDIAAEDVGDDYNKIRICDAQLIMYETIDLALSNQIGVKIGKNRDGEKPPAPIILLFDKSRMKLANMDGTPGTYDVASITMASRQSKLVAKKTTSNTNDNDDDVTGDDVEFADEDEG